MTGNTASTPLPVGPIRKLRVTTGPTSSVTMPALTGESYQGRIVGGMGARQNGLTIHQQRAKTTRLRTNAEGAVQWTGPSAKVVASQAVNARDTLIRSERRCAISTWTV